MKWKLDRVITIEHYTVTGQDVFGQEVKDWAVLIASACAEVNYQDAGGDEEIKSKQLLSRQIVEFKTRYIITNPNAKMRIVFEGATYNVLFIKPIDRRLGWIWRCELRDNTDGTIL
jgi:SPP1 family predicted phage head-tail adaptor